jgi:uncharacterized damage-inducible protein DinB
MTTTTTDRPAKIESYGRAYEQLAAALAEFPKEMWKFKPSPERWSIHEIIIHLADSEANSFVRARVFLAEPGKTIMAYDQEKWAKFMNYHDQDADTALDLFRALRKSTYELIRKAPADACERSIVHPEAGLMTMDRWLDIYEHHIPGHIDQMRKNFEAWKQRK